MAERTPVEKTVQAYHPLMASNVTHGRLDEGRFSTDDASICVGLGCFRNEQMCRMSEKPRFLSVKGKSLFAIISARSPLGHPSVVREGQKKFAPAQPLTREAKKIEPRGSFASDYSKGPHARPRYIGLKSYQELDSPGLYEPPATKRKRESNRTPSV